MVKIIRAILICLSLSLVSGFVCAGTICVDEDNIAGPWDGTPDHPYAVIQDGIDAAVDDDTVLVADGLYVGSGNMDIDFKGKAITVTSEKVSDAFFDSNTATVNITVLPVNDPPVAHDESVITDEDTSVSFSLTSHDLRTESQLHRHR